MRTFPAPSSSVYSPTSSSFHDNFADETTVSIETPRTIADLSRYEIDRLAHALTSRRISERAPQASRPSLDRIFCQQPAPKPLNLCDTHNAVNENMILSALIYLEGLIDDDLVYILRRICKKQADSSGRRKLSGKDLRHMACAQNCPELSPALRAMLMKIEDVMAFRISSREFFEQYHRHPPSNAERMQCEACVLGRIVAGNDSVLTGLRSIFLAVGIGWENRGAVITGRMARFAFLELIDGWMTLLPDEQGRRSMDQSWEFSAELKALMGDCEGLSEPIHPAFQQNSTMRTDEVDTSSSGTPSLPPRNPRRRLLNRSPSIERWLEGMAGESSRRREGVSDIDLERVKGKRRIGLPLMVMADYLRARDSQAAELPDHSLTGVIDGAYAPPKPLFDVYTASPVDSIGSSEMDDDDDQYQYGIRFSF